MKKGVIFALILFFCFTGNINVSASNDTHTQCRRRCESQRTSCTLPRDACDGQEAACYTNCYNAEASQCNTLEAHARDACISSANSLANLNDPTLPGYGFGRPQTDYLQCGNSGAFPAAFPKLIKALYTLVEIFVPLVLIILGMLDFAKAVSSSDADFLDKAKKKFLKRIISGAAVFLVFAIVKFCIGLLGNDSSDAVKCAKCFLIDTNVCEAATYEEPTN